MIELSKLFVTQEELRNEDQICAMIEFVKRGGVFNQQSLSIFAVENNPDFDVPPLIHINIFEDDRMFIHDGHHRLLSIFLGGREIVQESEYRITKKSYQDYLDTVFKMGNHWIGWVTPHDVREEVRFPDIYHYKDTVTAIYKDKSEEEARAYIQANRHLYVRPRTINHIHDLPIIEKLGCKIT